MYHPEEAKEFSKVSCYGSYCYESDFCYFQGIGIDIGGISHELSSHRKTHKVTEADIRILPSYRSRNQKSIIDLRTSNLINREYCEHCINRSERRRQNQKYPENFPSFLVCPSYPQI